LRETAKKTLAAFRVGGPILVLAKALRYLNGTRSLGDRLMIRTTARALQTQATSTRDIDAVLRFSYAFLGPGQVETEIKALLEILRASPPQAVLEIGTARGGTLFLLARSASDDATIISIDLPRGRFGGGYEYSRASLYRSFGLGGQHLELVRDDSHEPGTFELVEQMLAGRQLDLLFIDGDHSADGVRKDYELYSPLVREGGLIALHDIVPGPRELVGGVPDFWRTLKKSHNVEELVQDWEQGGFGIGLVKKTAFEPS
jgi:predicted O-methyltransferase YrrM